MELATSMLLHDTFCHYTNAIRTSIWTGLVPRWFPLELFLIRYTGLIFSVERR